MTDQEKSQIYDEVMTGRMTHDIVVLEDIHTAPVLNVDYHSQYFYIGLCSKGYILSHYDYRETIFKAGDICWILPDHVLSHQYVSDDYTVLSVFISKAFFRQLKPQGILGNFNTMNNISRMSLSPEVFQVIYESFCMIAHMIQIGTPRTIQQIGPMLRISSTICDEYISTQRPLLSSKERKNSHLFEQFYEAITEHFRESREVTFYARLLCLTPKYFATVIKEATGIPASEWINRYVIVEAKWMLQQERKKSIQQIALNLGFSEQASFSRLFKRYEGLTPNEFRHRY